MTAKTELSAPKRRSRAEVKQLVAEFVSNLAENSMCPVALGRKNWTHIGSPRAGPKIAAILSVVESCRRLKISVRDYLAAILPGLADLPIKRLSSLTPSIWASPDAKDLHISRL